MLETLVFIFVLGILVIVHEFGHFIAAKKSPDACDDYQTVFVLETKGDHLSGNSDTNYKKNVFELCNQLAWDELAEQFPAQRFEFQLVLEDEWQKSINEFMQ